MAGFAGSLGAFYVPFHEKHGDFNKPKGDFFMTYCTAATTGALAIVGKASADLDTYINWVTVVSHPSAANALIKLIVSADDTTYCAGIINAVTTTAKETLHINFGDIGVQLGTDTATTTSTNTMEVVLSGGTATMYCFASGYTRLRD